MTVLVTGGCGFISSNFIHTLSKRTRDKIVCFDDAIQKTISHYID